MHESNGSSSEGKVSLSEYWPRDAAIVLDTSSPSNEATSFGPALFEANICSHVSSNILVSLARDVVVSQEDCRGSVVLDIHPTSASFNLSNEVAASSSTSLPWFFEEKDQTPSLVVNAGLLCSLWVINQHF